MLKWFKRVRQDFYLRQMWMTAHILVGARTDWNEFEHIKARYSEPGRHYHGLDHLEHGLRFLEQYPHLERRARGLLMFVFFYHDVIMVFGAKDNEKKSALRLREYMIATNFMSDHETKRMENLLMGTRDHQNPKGMDDLPLTDPLWPILNDADLLVFSAPWYIYDRYAHNVWLEYSAICDRKTFIEGRAKFLLDFSRKPVFRTPSHMKKEKVAEANIRDELLRLGIES